MLDCRSQEHRPMLECSREIMTLCTCAYLRPRHTEKMGGSCIMFPTNLVHASKTPSSVTCRHSMLSPTCSPSASAVLVSNLYAPTFVRAHIHTYTHTHTHKHTHTHTHTLARSLARTHAHGSVEAQTRAERLRRSTWILWCNSPSTWSQVPHQSLKPPSPVGRVYRRVLP